MALGWRPIVGMGVKCEQPQTVKGRFVGGCGKPATANVHFKECSIPVCEGCLNAFYARRNQQVPPPLPPEDGSGMFVHRGNMFGIFGKNERGEIACLAILGDRQSAEQFREMIWDNRSDEFPWVAGVKVHAMQVQAIVQAAGDGGPVSNPPPIFEGNEECPKSKSIPSL